MSETRRYIMDTLRSIIRVGFVTLMLWLAASEFDETEATVIGGVAAAEFGIRGFDWTRKKNDQQTD